MNPGIAFVFEKGGRGGIMRLANFGRGEGLVGNHKVGKFLAESPCLGNHGLANLGLKAPAPNQAEKGGGRGKLIDDNNCFADAGLAGWPFGSFPRPKRQNSHWQ